MNVMRISQNTIILTLENRNTVQITEEESGVLQITNTTKLTEKQKEELGISIYPIQKNIIEIVPEG